MGPALVLAAGYVFWEADSSFILISLTSVLGKGFYMAVKGLEFLAGEAFVEGFSGKGLKKAVREF